MCKCRLTATACSSNVHQRFINHLTMHTGCCANQGSTCRTLSSPVIGLHGAHPAAQAICCLAGLLDCIRQQLRPLKVWPDSYDVRCRDVVLVVLLQLSHEGGVAQQRLHKADRPTQNQESIQHCRRSGHRHSALCQVCPQAPGNDLFLLELFSVRCPME